MKTTLKNNWLVMAVIVSAACLIAISCKREYTDPPQIGEPDIVANITIKDVKARYAGGQAVKINDDIVIEGIVGGDDRSGNYYQQIAIQDATGGVLLRLAGNNLFNNYPVGRQVFVKLKGLYLGQYGGTLQFGGGLDSAYLLQGGVTLLAPNLQPGHIIKGALNQPLVPKIVTVATLGTGLQDPYISTLIKFENFEFASSELSKNYADDGQSGNRFAQGCTNPTTNRITVRTSNYSNIATFKVGQGNGDLFGIYSVFGSTKQLTIRDTTDVRFYGPRCPTAAGGGVITLGTTSPFLLDFNNIGTGVLPIGVYVKQDATSSDLGNDGTVVAFNTPTAWNATALGFKNFASGTGLPSNTTTANQAAAANRALGFRQTGTAGTGGDPGAAFAFQLPNTTGKTNLQLEFKLQSLDGTAGGGRTTTWKVDYGFGASPTTFTAIATSPALLTTAFSVFSNTTVTVNFGSVLNNIAQPIWIRIVALTPTSGGGNRGTAGIDDVKFSWN